MALTDFHRFDFGVSPSGSFAEDVINNHTAFAKERKRDKRVRRLGHPRDLQATAALVSQLPPATPPPQYVDQSPKVLPGFNTRLVETATGPRPVAGGFHHAQSHWAPFHHLLPHRVLSILHTGVRLEWQGAPPMPLWLQNHKIDPPHREFVSLEVQSLLATGAIRYYDQHLFGPPICILPLLVMVDAAGGLRLCYDGRYLNSCLYKRTIRYETLDVLRLLLGPPMDPDQPDPSILKIDFKSGYHHALMEHGTEPFLVFEWEGRLYYWKALPFGLASAPEVFEFLMQKGLRKILRGPLQIPHIGYLDDSGAVLRHVRSVNLSLNDIVEHTRVRMSEGLLKCPTPFECPINYLMCFLFFGGSINVPKLAFGTLVEMLGILFDCQARKTFVPERRAARLLPMLQHIVDTPVAARIPVKLLAEIAGQLVSMYEALRFARQLLWAVFYAIY